MIEGEKEEDANEQTHASRDRKTEKLAKQKQNVSETTTKSAELRILSREPVHLVQQMK